MKFAKDVTVGQRVGAITGPGQFPQAGMCSMEGTITGTTVTKWEGEVVVIRWDGEDYDDTSRTVLEDGIDKRIGVYFLV